MDKNKTIIVIGVGKILPAALIQEIQHSHGMNVDVISYDHAKEKGLISPEELQIEHMPFIFRNLPQIAIPQILYDKYQAKNDCKKGWRKNR